MRWILRRQSGAKLLGSGLEHVVRERNGETSVCAPSPLLRQRPPPRKIVLAGLGGEKPVRSEIIEEINVFPHAEGLKGKTVSHIRESDLKKETLTTFASCVNVCPVNNYRPDKSYFEGAGISSFLGGTPSSTFSLVSKFTSEISVISVSSVIRRLSQSLLV